MSGVLLAALIAAIGALGAVAAAATTGWFGRRSNPLAVMQASLDARGEDIVRLNERVGDLEADRKVLRQDLADCHAERDRLSQRFTNEMAEMRRTIRALTDRETT